MLPTQPGSPLTFSGETYALTFPADRPFVYVDDSGGNRLMELFVLSSVHPLHGRDDTTGIGEWEVESTPDETIFSLRAGSSVWDTKVYRIRCTPRRFSYEIEVQGDGRLAEVAYFGGYASYSARWGSGFFFSGHHFTRGFNPEPTPEAHEFAPTSSARIDLLGVSSPGKYDWFFTPPPFCFAFEAGNRWLSLGVEARPGENRWTEYTYHVQHGFHLSLSYEGHTRVSGRYTLPAIACDFGRDPLEVLGTHVRALQASGFVPASATRDTPSWWLEPLYCGWGTQCAEAVRERGRAPDYARQQLYEVWLETLTQHGIDPGTVVIDDKWQATYGNNEVDPERWPDLPGFIAGQHASDKRVLLWLKAWDPEGVPADECITNAAGLPVAVDPSNPAFEQRLRNGVRQMLAPGGYDADGFKIDFTARIPSGPGMRLHGDTWGLELMRLYLGIIYDEAKHAKPDALIITHTPHPYLVDVLDMIRLNDIPEVGHLTDPESGGAIGAAMIPRARIAALACPGIPIDTDNWPVRDRASWREYVRLQPELGVPALYFVSHIDRTQEPLEEEDYALLRESWARYRAQRTNISPPSAAFGSRDAHSRSHE